MKSRFYCLTLSLYLFVLAGYFTDSQRIDWTFTLPQYIEAPVNTTVEIPCTFTAPGDPGQYLLVWYKYGVSAHKPVYQRNLHTNYVNRTSIIRNGTDCSLRIKGVIRTAWYFPEISNRVFNLSNEKKPVMVNVTGCRNRTTCSDWSFTFPTTIKALRGSCVEIPCTLTHPANYTDSELFWFLRTPKTDREIFSNRTTFRINPRYDGRTSLVWKRRNSCTLRINDVKNGGEYYPGINRVINAYSLYGKFCTVNVEDFPPKPEITGAENLTESKAANITCAVNHTCRSSPPVLEWSIDNSQSNFHENLTKGNWRMFSGMEYVPSVKDHGRSLECKATFPNGQISAQYVTLFIEGPTQTLIITIIALSGIACLLLLILLVFLYKRKKMCQTPVSSEVGESPDRTYASLEKKEVAKDYDTLKFGVNGAATTGSGKQAPDYENVQKN
ncbi:myeloid cell surface antigen CD33-like [Leptodactylus fuscus]